MEAGRSSIATRIKGHRQQVKGMLTPGLSASARAGSVGRLPAIFTNFGVGKAKMAATKMRFLNHRRMGKVQVEASKAFSQTIPQKFQEVQTLLHINPRVSREASIWGELEKTLPSQGGTRYEEPPQPGELRAGSVIQKFSMFPKEGQSIESFKKQAQSLPKPASQQRVIPSNRRTDPRAKLFSQVQEISTSKSTGNKQERPPELPFSDKRETVQRQDVLHQRQEERPLVEKPEVPVADKTQTNADMLNLLSAAMDGQVESSQQAAGTGVGVEEQRPKAPPHDEPPLKKDTRPAQSKPASETKWQVQKTPTLAQAKPIKGKPEGKKEIARPVAKAQPSVAKVSAPAVQRKVDAKSAAKPAHLPVFEASRTKEDKSLVKKELTSEKVKEKPETSSQQKEISLPKLEEVPEKETSPIPPAEMPLRKKIQARHEAQKAIKTLRSETIKSAELKPLLPPHPRPLVSPQKYRRTQKPDETVHEPVAQQPSFPQASASSELPDGFAELDSLFRERSGQQAPVQSAPFSTKPMGDGRQQLSMALAKIPRNVQQTVPLPAEKQQELLPELRTQPERLLPSKPEEQRLEQPRLPISTVAQETPLVGGSLVSGQKVVQRQPNDDTNEPETNEVLTPDLDQLAEDVLPYVKRILEIESERIPGSLR